MTIVAAMEGVMMADSGRDMDGHMTICSFPKIVRLSGDALFGSCGLATDCYAVQQWLLGNEPRPEIIDTNQFAGLILTRSGMMSLDEKLRRFPYARMPIGSIGYAPVTHWVEGFVAGGGTLLDAMNQAALQFNHVLPPVQIEYL